jgi:hypothetical protein
MVACRDRRHAERQTNEEEQTMIVNPHPNVLVAAAALRRAELQALADADHHARLAQPCTACCQPESGLPPARTVVNLLALLIAAARQH